MIYFILIVGLCKHANWSVWIFHLTFFSISHHEFERQHKDHAVSALKVYCISLAITVSHPPPPQHNTTQHNTTQHNTTQHNTTHRSVTSPVSSPHSPLHTHRPPHAKPGLNHWSIIDQWSQPMLNDRFCLNLCSGRGDRVRENSTVQTSSVLRAHYDVILWRALRIFEVYY